MTQLKCLSSQSQPSMIKILIQFNQISNLPFSVSSCSSLPHHAVNIKRYSENKNARNSMVGKIPNPIHTAHWVGRITKSDLTVPRKKGIDRLDWVIDFLSKARQLLQQVPVRYVLCKILCPCVWLFLSVTDLLCAQLSLFTWLGL